MLAMLVAAYALSPIDLIPDVIPVIGLLDDLLIVPAGLWMAIRMIPRDLMQAFRLEAEAIAKRPKSTAGAVFVVTLWLAGIFGLLWWYL